MGRLIPLLLLLAAPLLGDVSAVYLSWYGDPCTTMAVQWHTPAGETSDEIFLQSLDDGWYSYEGTHAPLEHLQVHTVRLENLDPDTLYSFRIGSSPTVYKFRTAPAVLDQPIRFVIGGDVYATSKLFRKMNQAVVQNDPLFAVLGGDIAYALHINPLRLKTYPLRRWLSFLSDWTEQMRTADNRLIPFLLVPGNHDIASDNYDLFFSLFAYPQKQLYRALDFGKYLSLILLDTGHFQPIEGRQTLWLDQALSSRTDIPFRFAVYHMAAYPSHYPYQDPIPKKIRSLWTPLFEKHKILGAFEHHNHVFKRTYPIKANRIDPSGIIYFGDGSWGGSPRKVLDMWYLAKKARKNSVYVLEVSPSSASVRAIDFLNQPLDELILPPITN